MKCLNCSVSIVSIGTKPKKYCSDKCRKQYVRALKANGINTEQTDKRTGNLQTDTDKRTSLEQCRYCGVDLPKLSRPRRSPGACYPCAIAQPSKPRDNSLSSQPAMHTTHSMTVMERLFYRPADQLKPGQYNFVSLPGRACYGVYE